MHFLLIMWDESSEEVYHVSFNIRDLVSFNIEILCK